MIGGLSHARAHHLREAAIVAGSAAAIGAIAVALVTARAGSLTGSTSAPLVDRRAPSLVNGRTATRRPAVYAIGAGRWQPRLASFGDGVGASAVSLATAQRIVPFSMGVPTSSLAPVSAIAKVWVWQRSDSSQVVVIEYPKLEIVEQPMPGSFDPAAAYAAMVEQHADPHASTARIAGAPAYLAPPYTDRQGVPHPGYVASTEAGVQTTVEGYFSADALTAIAGSIRPVPTSG